MTDLIHVLLGLGALTGLVWGAEKAVDHAIGLMAQEGLSGTFIGLVVISIGTSLPEIVTHVLASIGIVTGRLDYETASSTVLGMNIGSDIIQQNLLIGVVALFGLLKVTGTFVWRDVLVLILAAAVVWGFALDGGGLSRFEGALLVFGYAIYLLILFRDRRKSENVETPAPEEDVVEKPVRVYWAWIVAGLVIVVTSGHFMLQSVEHFVHRFGIGGSMIGVVVIGVATALPELSTAITSIRRRHAALSISTLVGSNITNPMLAIGLGAAISGYAVPSVVVHYDLPVKIATAVLIFVLFLWDRKLSRPESVTLIVSYFVYLGVRVWLFPSDTYM